MAQARKDSRGRVLRKGEVQRSSDKRYVYTCTDPLGRRKFIYANDLVELREKEKKLVRHALKVEEQAVFMDFVANSPVYCKWWPLFAVLLGTGCRIGECLGLRWDDLDYDKRVISINHSIVYYPDSESRSSETAEC